MKKSEILTQKLDILQEYCIDQNFPFHSKLEDMRKNYTLEFVVGMIERFLIPAYDDDTLSEYIEAELERMKLLHVTGGGDVELLKFRLNNEQKALIVEHLSYIIKIIKL